MVSRCFSRADNMERHLKGLGHGGVYFYCRLGIMAVVFYSTNPVGEEGWEGGDEVKGD